MLWFNKDGPIARETEGEVFETKQQMHSGSDLEVTPSRTSRNEKKGYRGEVQVNTVEAQNALDNQEMSEEAQPGIKKMEAITMSWSKRDLIIAYCLIFVINFVDAMQQGTTGLLGPWVTSSFNAHGLTPATSVAAYLVAGLFKLPLSKIIDIWGRPQGFACMVFLMTLGLLLQAVCNGVAMYSAAQVFYWIGYTGTVYILGVFVADTSKLRNRGLMFGLTSCVYIATVWITGPLSAAFLGNQNPLSPDYMDGPGWRWCFGAFAIITPAVCAPLFFLFLWNERKAKKAGLIVKREASGRTWIESCKYWAVEFDLVGLFLITGGLGLFLLPFSIYYYQPNGWKEPFIIAMITIGGIMIILFAIWERYFAPVTYIPYDLLLDRTVFGACVLAATIFVCFYIWNSYFTSMLQVVYNLELTPTGYISNIYSIGSCFWSIVVGLVIRYTGRYKPVALYFGVPFTILGVALMIKFRQPDVNIGYIIMCQIFYAFAGGTLVITEQIAALAVTSHQYIAVVLAIEGMFSSVGGAIGGSISTAIWTGVFPGKLLAYLPEETKGNFSDIFGSIGNQKAYAPGTPTRIAINQAYGDAQKMMLIASTAVLAIAVLAVMLWRDVNIKNFKQVKGTVV